MKQICDMNTDFWVRILGYSPGKGMTVAGARFLETKFLLQRAPSSLYQSDPRPTSTVKIQIIRGPQGKHLAF